MKRIDPATVPDVFRRRGLKPASGVFVGDAAEGECCVLSALYCDARGCEEPGVCLAEIEAMHDDESPDCLSDRLADAIGVWRDAYSDGVMHGWDDPDIGHLVRDGIIVGAYADGLRDGGAARKAVEAAGMVIAIREPADEDDEDDLDFEDDDFEDFDDDDDEEEETDE